MRISSCLSLVSIVLLVGCSDDDGGTGSLTLQISGEEAAQTGFPVPDVPELAFADGWALHFERYLISLGNIRIAGADGEIAWNGDESVLVDLVQGEPLIFQIEGLPARRWERFSYEILPASSASRRVGNLVDADVARMVEGGFNYLITGIATKAGETHHFSWGLTNPTLNHDCVDGSDDSPGVVIRNNADAAYQITLHLDHLFYEQLGDHDGAKMRFDAIAAMATMVDGVSTIAFDDLEAQRLSDLRDREGEALKDQEGQRVFYSAGSVNIGDANLRDYLLAAAKSQGRFNGEGVCVNTNL